MLKKMRSARRFCCRVCCIVGILSSFSYVANAEDGYLMTPGDELNIQVAEHDELSKGTANGAVYIVRPDGMVSFPLVGQLDTKGKTVEVFTAELEDRLARYLVDPQVSVNINKLGKKRVYVFGEVKMPGLYELPKSHCVLDAIGAAQGFTRDTAKKNIFLIHKDHTGDPIKINLNRLLEKADISQNYELVEGDMLYMTRNGRIDFARDILPFISGSYMIDNIMNNHDTYGNR